MGRLILGHQLAVLNVPHGDVTAIIRRHDGLELRVEHSKGHRILVRRLYLLLRFEEPEVDFARAKHDVVGMFVKMERCEHVVGPVAELVSYDLDAKVAVEMPDLDYFVRS